MAEQSLERTSEMASLLAEKARISEEEAIVLARRAAEADAEVQRVRLSAAQAEHAKMMIERRAREQQLMFAPEAGRSPSDFDLQRVVVVLGTYCRITWISNS